MPKFEFIIDRIQCASFIVEAKDMDAAWDYVLEFSTRDLDFICEERYGDTSVSLCDEAYDAPDDTEPDLIAKGAK